MKRSSKGLLVVVVLGCVALAGLGYWTRVQLQPVSASGEAVIVEVERGHGASEISQQLEAAGLVRNARALQIYLVYSGLGKGLKAGYYELSAAMSGIQIAEKLVAGKTGSKRVTVPEGLRLDEIAERVADSGLVNAAEFMAAATPAALAGQVSFALPRGSVEGYLLPETYEFRLDAGAETIVRRMAGELDKQFATPNAEAIEASGLSLHEIITLASLVEREAKVAVDRAKIAGVLTNRLTIGMKLQCDATVQYALAEHKSRLTFEDLKVDSPYNTYLHKGLPPGPIAAPGIASLQAALEPAETDALFYVARADGSHVFTRTYEEHKAAIRQIRGE